MRRSTYAGVKTDKRSFLFRYILECRDVGLRLYGLYRWPKNVIHYQESSLNRI